MADLDYISGCKLAEILASSSPLSSSFVIVDVRDEDFTVKPRYQDSCINIKVHYVEWKDKGVRLDAIGNVTRKLSLPFGFIHQGTFGKVLFYFPLSFESGSRTFLRSIIS